MDHPNWRALATVNIPYKVFVTPESRSQEIKEAESKLYEIRIGDTKAAYEEIIESIPETRQETWSNQEPTFVPAAKPKTAFRKSYYFKACTYDDIQALEEMDLSVQSNLNALDEFGWSALMMAACAGAGKTFMFLLDMGIDFEIVDKSNRSAINLAETKNHFHILETFQQFVNSRFRTNDASAPSQNQGNGFFCATCNVMFNQTPQNVHQTSVLHKFNSRVEISNDWARKYSYAIPKTNQGYQLMLKHGWDGESGLGPLQAGSRFPVKTVLRQPKSGLGLKQKGKSRVTHFRPHDLSAIKFRKQERNIKSKRELQAAAASDKKLERELRKELS